MAKHVAPAVLGAVVGAALAPHHPEHHGPHHSPHHGPHHAPPHHPHPEPVVHHHPEDVHPKDLEPPKGRLSMEGQLRVARWSLEHFVHPHNLLDELIIPQWVLQKARGIVFLSVVKAGFIFAAKAGTGVIIVRQPDGNWSGPSSVGCGGISLGFQAGASSVHYVMILTTESQVAQFSGNGQLRLGGEIQLAVGPVGRNGHGSVGVGKNANVIFTYSHAQGLFGGLALDGKVISVRNGCNHTFYGKAVECNDILTGKVGDFPKNKDYDAIIRLLNRHSNLDNVYHEVKEQDVSSQVAVEKEEEKAPVIESNIQSGNIAKENIKKESDDDMDICPDEMVTDEGVNENETAAQ